MRKAIQWGMDRILSVRAMDRARRRVTRDSDRPLVFYGWDHIPGPGEPIHGGLVKFQKLQGLYPNSPRHYNLVYLLSSSMPGYAPAMAAAARARGAKVVWNQNGVAFPAWHGAGWERTNAPMRRLLHLADHVFYQSDFCRRSADRYLGERQGAAEILYNPVDTGVFRPAAADPAPGSLILLAAGSHEQRYRVETAMETLARLRRWRPDARLILAGRFNWRPSPGAARQDILAIGRRLGLLEAIDLRGPYTQDEAPALMREAHVLIHTKCNDPCPALVLEALASGLPVVYSDSGGTPELVGPDAGIGVRSRVTWESYEAPAPDLLADAVRTVAEDRSRFAQAARRRAVDRFDLSSWMDRHRQVFESLSS